MRIRDIAPHGFRVSLASVANIAVPRYFLPVRTYPFCMVEREHGLREWLQPAFLLSGIVFGILRCWPCATGSSLFAPGPSLDAYHDTGSNSHGRRGNQPGPLDPQRALAGSHARTQHTARNQTAQHQRVVELETTPSVGTVAISGVLRSTWRVPTRSKDEGNTACSFRSPPAPARTRFLAILAMTPQRMVHWWGGHPPSPSAIDAAMGDTRIGLGPVYLGLPPACTRFRLWSLARALTH